jgi:hypothetical protein
MLSHSENVRRLAEHATRVAVLGVLAWAAWAAWNPRAESRKERVGSRELPAALARWTSDPGIGGVHVEMRSPPGPVERAWLRGLAAAGVDVGWSGDLAALAVAASPIRDPLGGVIVSVTGTGDGAIGIEDAAGPLDSLESESGAATLTLRAAARPIRARVARVEATARKDGTPTLRGVLVLGRASWETRFAVIALEERGWRVTARIPVAPGIDVTQGSLQPIDTGRYSAVVILDSTGQDLAAAVTRYVRSGGGLVLAGDAGRVAGLAQLAPGVVGRRVGSPIVIEARGPSLDILGFHPITRTSADAAVLRADRGSAAIAVRRVEGGRVLHAGYDESWRLRMAGGADGEAAHREWWSRLVSTVAYAPIVEDSGGTADGGEADGAPLAALHHALGGPAPAAAARAGLSGEWRRPEHLVLILILILAEVVSRRARGAR